MTMITNSEAQTAKLAKKERSLEGRLDELNKKKFDRSHADLDVVEDDLLEVSAGEKIVAAKRSTLTTQLKGTRFEALFSGRWDKEPKRDSHSCILSDVKPVRFQAIASYLNGMAISSEDSPPSPPGVDDEHKYIPQHQLELFVLLDLWSKGEMPDSNIIKDEDCGRRLHSWSYLSPCGVQDGQARVY